MPAGPSLTSKGQRRRDAIMDATIELVAEVGYAGVTHRGVAQRAGVPLSTTSYYFPSIEALVVASVIRQQGLLVQGLDAALRLFIDAHHNPEQGVEALVDLLFDFEPAWLLVNYEVYLNVERVPEIRDAANHLLAAFERAAHDALAAAGAPDPGSYAPALVAVIDGHLLHRTARPTPDDRRSMTVALRAIVHAALASDAERARMDRRLARPVRRAARRSADPSPGRAAQG